MTIETAMAFLIYCVAAAIALPVVIIAIGFTVGLFDSACVFVLGLFTNGR